MKFGKQLEKEQLSQWIGAYLDYKMMKKVLKTLDGPCVVNSFCNILEAQLFKVHSFVNERQKEIRQSVGGVVTVTTKELGLNTPCTLAVRPARRLERLDLLKQEGRLQEQCSDLVISIEQLRNFTALNQTAFRKIVKKFDKRFQMSFRDSVVELSSPIPINVKELEAWLLKPALQCLRLMRFADPRVELPIRQFNFWVEELKAGCQWANLRFNTSAQADCSTTAIRLRMCQAGPESMRLCIKNTFIDGHLDDDSDDWYGIGNHMATAQPRSRSVPSRRACADELELDVPALDDLDVEYEDSSSPCPSERERTGSGGSGNSGISGSLCTASSFHSDWSTTVPQARRPTYVASQLQGPLEDHTPIVLLEHAICDVLEAAPPPRDLQSRQRCIHNGDDDDDDDEEDDVLMTLPVQRGNGHRNGRPVAATSHSGQSGTTFGGDRSLPEYQRGRSIIRGPADDNRQFAKAPSTVSSNPRWWSEVDGICPLSGFPVQRLPYPPYKLPVPGKAPKEIVLVDGQFLVLTILASWQFEALGRALTVSDVNNLDLYMKRCKLGPWRLGGAVQLLSEGTSEAQAKLEALRSRARRKLETLRRIQRSRVNNAPDMPVGSSMGGAEKPQRRGGGARGRQDHRARARGSYPHANAVAVGLQSSGASPG